MHLALPTVIALVLAINPLVVFSLAERKTTNKRRKVPLRKPYVAKES
jgi:hypothetical protein